MVKAWQPQDRKWERHCTWSAPPWRAIEMKIGEELREWYVPPQELPHTMLTLLLQFSRETEGGDGGKPEARSTKAHPTRDKPMHALS
jgi:hypothetical protein